MLMLLATALLALVLAWMEVPTPIRADRSDSNTIKNSIAPFIPLPLLKRTVIQEEADGQTVQE